MKRLPFDCNIDYVAAHMQWLTNRPCFEKVIYEFAAYEIYKNIYDNIGDRSKRNYSAYIFMGNDIESSEPNKVERQMKQALYAEDDKTEKWVFVTVGWNAQTVTPKLALEVSDRIARYRDFNRVRYVFEKYRENGEHHHSHFLIDSTKTRYTVSKLVQQLYKIKGIKGITLGPSSIDVKAPWSKKEHASYHVYEEYIKGNKKIEKLPYVYKDRNWRRDMNVCDLFEIDEGELKQYRYNPEIKSLVIL